MTVSINYCSIPGVTTLFRDFLYTPQKVADFYRGHFRDKDSFIALVSRLKTRDFPRSRLAEILVDQNYQFNSQPKTFENLKLLTNAEALAVFCGQQVGLFGGPLFTIYKAISTIKWAIHLTALSGVPVIPFFWMSTDDHDFAEVDHINLPEQNNQLTKVRYNPEQPHNGTSMAHMVLDATINQTLHKYDALLIDSKFKPDVLASLSRCYRAGEKLATAFARWLNHLLGDRGLVIVYPSDERLKALVVPLFAKEIQKSSDSSHCLQLANQALQTAHYNLQVRKPESVVNLFYHNGKRCNIRRLSDDLRANERFIIDGINHQFRAAELLDLLKKSPSSFSPNVFLRPVMQSTLFPVVAQINGPSETAYFAQIKPLFQQYDVEMPIVCPRASITIVEKRIYDLLNKYQLPIERLFADADGAINQVLRQTIPDPFEKRFNQIRQIVQAEITMVEPELTSLDPTLQATLGSVKSKIDFELKNLSKKAFAAQKKKNEVLQNQLQRVRTHLYPDLRLQERQFNIVYYLVKYGWNFIDQLFDFIQTDQTDHQLFYPEATPDQQ